MDPTDCCRPGASGWRRLRGWARATVVLTLSGPQIACGAGIVAVRGVARRGLHARDHRVRRAAGRAAPDDPQPDRLGGRYRRPRPSPDAARAGGQDQHPTTPISRPCAWARTGRAWCGWCSTSRKTSRRRCSRWPRSATTATGSVFDLYPVNPPDPLWKLVRDTEDKPAPLCRLRTRRRAAARAQSGAPSGAEEDAIGALGAQARGQGPGCRSPPRRPRRRLSPSSHGRRPSGPDPVVARRPSGAVRAAADGADQRAAAQPVQDAARC